MAMMKTLIFLRILVIIIFALSQAHTVKAFKDTTQTRQWFKKQPLQFTENKGQLADQDGNLLSDIRYVVKAPGFHIYLYDHKIQYVWRKIDHTSPSPYTKKAWDSRSRIDQYLNKSKEQTHITSHSLTMELLDANPEVEVIAENPTLEKQNYYLAHCPEGILGVQSYTKVIYKNIYPNIDLILYTNANSKAQNRLKYDFIIHPGANPDLIQLKYTGQESIQTTPKGSISFKHKLGDLEEGKPFTYQHVGDTIACNYHLDGDIVSFNLGAYDISEDLVIDPELIWATYYGGGEFDVGHAVTTDLQGNVYLAGSTASETDIAFNGYKETLVLENDTTDAFVVKFNTSGQRIWATYYGGEGIDRGLGVITDLQGNVYLAGTTESNSGISFNGYDNFFGGVEDAFLVKFDESGQRLWATYYGGEQMDGSNTLSSDLEGNIYLAGSTASETEIAFNGHDNFFGGMEDAFLVKFNSSGQRLWATYYGGDNTDYVKATSADSQGSIFLAGGTKSDKEIAFNGYSNNFGGQEDAFLVKFDSSGERLWATYYGGDSIDVGNSIVTDNENNIYMSGGTQSRENIYFNGHDSSYAGGIWDIFLVKFNTLGQRIWATYYGSTGADVGRYLASDNIGNIYVAGDTNSESDIAFNAPNSIYGGDLDAFLVKFNTLGQRIWATYFGGERQDLAFGLATDIQNNIYITGETNSDTNIALLGHDDTLDGAKDAFLAKFCGSLFTPSINLNPFSTSFCVSDNIRIPSLIQGGGNAPSMEWFVNEQSVGNSLDNFDTSTPGIYQVYARVISNADCAINEAVNSDTVSIEIVYDQRVPQVDISIDIDKACRDTQITLKAEPFFGGNSPSYTWYSNNRSIGTTNSEEFTINTNVLSLGINQIYARMNSNSTCASLVSVVSSNIKEVIVVEQLEPSVSLISIEDGRICVGERATFLAVPQSNALSPLLYEWKVNGETFREPSTDPNFVLATLQDGDTVTVEIISDKFCVNPSRAVSNPIVMQVDPIPGVSITSELGDLVCVASLPKLKALPTRSGSNTTYQWRILKDGNAVFFEDFSAASELDIGSYLDTNQTLTIDLAMKTTTNCGQGIYYSNTLTIESVDSVVTFARVSSNQGDTLCEDSEADFFVTSNINDPDASYQWFLNDTLITGNENSLTLSEINQGDIVKVVFQPDLGNFPCASAEAVSTFEVITRPLPSPVNLVADAVSESEIILTWEDQSQDETRYLLERLEGNNQGFEFLSAIFANQSSFIDLEVNPRTTYFYRLRVQNENYANCYSPYSNISGAATSGDTILPVEPEISLRGIKIFPSPSLDGTLHVEIDNTYVGDYQLKITDIHQRVISLSKLQKNQIEKVYTLDLERLNQGLYLLHLQSTQGVIVLPWIR